MCVYVCVYVGMCVFMCMCNMGDCAYMHIHVSKERYVM